MTRTRPLPALTRLLRNLHTMAPARPDLQRSSAAFDASIGITERVTKPATIWHGVMRHRYIALAGFYDGFRRVGRGK